MFKGLGPNQKLAATVIGGMALFFLGFVGSSYFQRPRPLEIVQQSAGSSAQRIIEPGVVENAAATVHVVGAVARPGVYTLSSGAKINDAIKAAGGASSDADLESINLAERIIDGSQIRVLKKGEVPVVAVVPMEENAQPVPSATGSSKQQAAIGLVSINNATLEELDTLPGIGPVKAQAIIDYRKKIGGFKSLDELNAVKGIGDKTFADLLPHIKI